MTPKILFKKSKKFKPEQGHYGLAFALKYQDKDLTEVFKMLERKNRKTK